MNGQQVQVTRWIDEKVGGQVGAWVGGYLGESIDSQLYVINETNLYYLVLLRRSILPGMMEVEIKIVNSEEQ